MVGESQPPSFGRRLLPELGVLLGVCCGVGSIILLLARPGEALAPMALGLGAAACIGFALRLEARLSRRRFVLHFHTETLRLERLTWAPGATRTQAIPFDEVTAVEVLQHPSGHLSLRVAWREGAQEHRAVLVERIRPSEARTLHRVHRMLHNAFGLRASEPSAG